jgi:hypothetical protein
MFGELIYEWIQEQLGDAIDYAAWVMDHVDKTQRLTHVAVAVTILGAEHTAWRTLRESEANRNSMTIGNGSDRKTPVTVLRPRAALRLSSAHLIEDLLVPLRRQWK